MKTFEYIRTVFLKQRIGNFILSVGLIMFSVNCPIYAESLESGQLSNEIGTRGPLINVTREPASDFNSQKGTELNEATEKVIGMGFLLPCCRDFDFNMMPDAVRTRQNGVSPNTDQVTTQNEILYALLLDDAIKAIRGTLRVQSKILVEGNFRQKEGLLKDIRRTNRRLRKVLADYQEMRKTAR